MPDSSRKGKKISRRACDLCRDRRLQCAFPDDDACASCLRCLQTNVPCTFMTPRKPRGPPSRRIAEHRLQGFQASSLPSLPLGSVTIHHFLTEPVFNKILDDFLSQVYPVLPLVHIPSFLNHRAERRFETDPRFFRLCLALCAVTVASIPRSVSGYRCARSCSWYTGAADMVERASQLVLLSRLSSDPGWQDSPSADSLLVSALMAMACHYAGKPVAGWGYASEAVHLFREMELYSKATYREMDVVNGEICKRLFWLLTIIQVHDRISFTIPHTGLSYDAKHTDWEFLFPLELSDDEMVTGPLESDDRPTPIISGYIALIRVFICVIDTLDTSFPGPPSYYRMSHGGVAAGILGSEHQHPPPEEKSQLEALLQILTRLDLVLSNLPEPLQLRRDPGQERKAVDAKVDDERRPQFDIMRTNIHITAIYFQSLILEMCLSQPNPADLPDETGATQAGRQLWKIKESVAGELLDILNCSSPAVLEANGYSMIRKIREVAATFLDDSRGPVACDVELRTRSYPEKFVEILAILDYHPQLGSVAK